MLALLDLFMPFMHTHNITIFSTQCSGGTTLLENKYKH